MSSILPSAGLTGAAGTLADLPEINQTRSGHDRLFVYAQGWPRWREADGRCFTLVITDRPGGYYRGTSRLAKEQIPECPL